jgi:hypothetical protein
VQNASLVTDDLTAASSHFVRDNLYSLTSGTTYTFSLYAKSNGRNIGFNFDPTVGASSPAVFNLSNGTVLSYGSFTASIEDVGNGWYRCVGTFTASATTSSYIYVRGVNSSGSIIYDGDGTSGFYTYGFQLEVGSYPTSYIPTYGSSVTRVQDFCRKTNVETILNDSQGTLFLEMQGISDGGNSRRLTISDGSTSNRVSIEYDETAGSIKSFYTGQGTLNGTIIATGLTQTDNHKVALVYNSSVFKMFIDGVLKGTDTTITSLPVGLDVIEFQNGATSLPMEGRIKQTLYIPTALTDQEAIDLTTI